MSFFLHILAYPESNNKEFLGNGGWPAPMSSPAAVNPSSVRPSVVETTDFNPKMAYKMTSRPRGVAIIVNNRHFTCGMKERIGE